MTAVKVLSPRMLRSPEQVADYFLYGADYIVDVSEEMGFETDDLDERIENAYDAMSEGETDVDDEVAAALDELHRDVA
ncbi:MAG: hypothetical protein SV760_09955, partial [Halobacteria archaeon]|nr:hypothetical protein [Halobacteria archaeon]